MKSLRKKIIAYFLGLFTLPRVKEIIAGYAKAFLGEAGRYSTGIKTEAIETKETFLILSKYIKKEKISREEKKQFKKQVIDILRSSGVMVPVMLIPLPIVGTVLLIIMDHLLMSMNIQLLPDSFYPKEKKELLTTEGIEKDLENEKISRF
ncbi:MAG: LETM1 domain-containing protein [Bacteroidales bacterium]|nr:LETM1 domain-containing protein [Bacteroidales bacterium]